MSFPRINRLTEVTILLCVILVIVSGRSTVGRCDDVQASVAIDRLRFPPLGLPAVPIPPDNPVTVEKIALGRKLFFDRRLSKNGTMSCGMCHIPEQAFTNNELATPVGINGQSVRRNAPTILNVAYQQKLFQDGRAKSLEAQAILPLFAPDEMGNESVEEFIRRLSELEDYRGLFERAFRDGPNMRYVGQAIASFERTLLAGDSAFDRWRFGGQQQALDTNEKRGFELFVGKAGCVQCHAFSETNTLFTDQMFHNTGIGYIRSLVSGSETPVTIEISPGTFISANREFVAQVEGPRSDDLGRHEVTDQPDHKWQYRTPSLRNVAVTAPYMHDGSLRSLDAVVRHYNRGGAAHAGLDSLIKPLHLDDDEIASLVAFLRTLTASTLAALEVEARGGGIEK